MSTISTPELKHTAPEDETERLARLAAQGLVILPRNPSVSRFRVQVPARDKSASEMVLEDRR